VRRPIALAVERRCVDAPAQRGDRLLPMARLDRLELDAQPLRERIRRADQAQCQIVLVQPGQRGGEAAQRVRRGVELRRRQRARQSVTRSRAGGLRGRRHGHRLGRSPQRGRGTQGHAREGFVQRRRRREARAQRQARPQGHEGAAPRAPVEGHSCDPRHARAHVTTRKLNVTLKAPPRR
jgi:hypothetical protein